MAGQKTIMAYTVTQLLTYLLNDLIPNLIAIQIIDFMVVGQRYIEQCHMLTRLSGIFGKIAAENLTQLKPARKTGDGFMVGQVFKLIAVFHTFRHIQSNTDANTPVIEIGQFSCIPVDPADSAFLVTESKGLSIISVFVGAALGDTAKDRFCRLSDKNFS